MIRRLKHVIEEALWKMTWRALLSVLMMAGCTSEACRPEPMTDETPPAARLQVTFTDPKTGRRDSTALTVQDATTTIWADPDEAVVVAYVGVDPEGMKRIDLGVTIQQTVGVGVQTRSLVLEPIEASCPVDRLSGEKSFVGGQGERNLLLGVIAENWLRQRVSTPTLVVRQQEPR